MRKFLFVICVFLTAGCSGNNFDTGKNTVAAFADGEKITYDDISREIEKIPQVDRARFQNPDRRKYILNLIIERRLLEREAERRRISEKRDISNKIESCRKQIVVNALKEEISSSVPKVSEAEVLEYYKDHADDFNQPQKIKVQDMVLKDEQLAKTAIKRLKKGEDFGLIARELSIDPYTRERSGDIPEFSRETRPDLYDEVILKAVQGRIIGPVKSGGGIHVLKLLKIIPLVDRNFKEVEDQIKVKLNATRQSESYLRFMKDLRESAKIKVNEDLLAK